MYASLAFLISPTNAKISCFGEIQHLLPPAKEFYFVSREWGSSAKNYSCFIAICQHFAKNFISVCVPNYILTYSRVPIRRCKFFPALSVSHGLLVALRSFLTQCLLEVYHSK